VIQRETNNMVDLSPEFGLIIKKHIEEIWGRVNK
jgi:hypothetical protein